MVDRLEVAVVGGGPVGVTTGLLLAQQGVRCAVLERARDIHPLPRAVHLDEHALRALDLAGVGAEVAARARPVAGMALVDARLRPFLTFRRDQPVPEGLHPPSVLVHQPDVEALLRRRAGSLLRTGVEVLGLQLTPEGVRLQLRGGGTVHAGWVVACDGASGALRTLAGIAREDLRFAQRWLVADFQVDPGWRAPPLVLQVCDPARPATSVPVGPGRHRFEFRAADGESDSALQTRAVALARPWLGNHSVRLERAAVYEFRARVAATFRRERMLLAGDAAHQMPPFLGQGLSSGLRDAANLSWKLAWVIRRHADPALLDTYPAEVIPQVRRIIRVTRTVGRIIADRHPVRAAVRNGALRALERASGGHLGAGVVQMPRLGPGPLTDRRHGGGRPLPQAMVAMDGAPVPLDGLLGSGLAIVGVGVDPVAAMTAEQAPWWRDLGVRWLAVDSPPGAGDGSIHAMRVADLGGRLSRWAGTPRVVVVRPDRMVLGAYPPAGRPLDAVAVRLRRAGL